jgi:predicted glycosyltransferase
MASCAGVLCGAGFETPAEALYLGKKLMVIPMSNQYEQQCNAEALKSMGIPVLNKLKAKHLDKISDWVASDFKIEISYPDITDSIVHTLFDLHLQNILKKNKWEKNYRLSFPTGKKKERINPKQLYKEMHVKNKDQQS